MGRRPPPGLYGPKISREQELALFSRETDCPKCGFEDVGIVWFPRFSERKALDSSPDPREHIRLTCDDCGYAWSEAPMDSVLEDAASDAA